MNTSLTNPLPTPLTQTDRLNWLRLIRSRRVGPATFFRLLDEHGSAEAALDFLPQIARDAGVSAYSTFSHKAAYDELTNGTAMGLKLLCFADPEYPELLSHIPDPPPILWAMGDITLLNRPTIAIVGARNASSLGTRMTRKLVTDLSAEGFVIASGLARGIDAAAHTAALPTGTIAVQAGGVDVVYPRENAALHDDIAAQGVRISENALGLIPQARHFPQRNRIIAGVAQATLVVEGAIPSGSLITARDAIDLGRDVMAIPGNPMDPRAAGCNALIRDGATLIRSAQDVIDTLIAPEPIAPSAPKQRTLALTPPDQIATKILTLLGPTAVPEDSLIRDVGLPASEIAPHLTTLELEGKIHRRPGGLLALAV
ncbi:MAG: DNA-processing protein DprA [Amylibacter sp.]|jgi:DNA processing protein|nr:DNA-processing protein DprA [Amylibacter sp.]